MSHVMLTSVLTILMKAPNSLTLTSPLQEKIHMYSPNHYPEKPKNYTKLFGLPAVEIEPKLENSHCCPDPGCTGRKIDNSAQEIFRESNFYFLSSNPQLLWQKLVPHPFQSSAKGIDISVIFSGETIDEGIKELVIKTNLFPSNQDLCCSLQYKNITQYLKQCFEQFIEILPNYDYKVRIVSSRGSKGVKCPRWHIDHVPARLILSLHGRGVKYARSSRNSRELLDSFIELETKYANEKLENEFDEIIQFGTSDVVILMGGEWETDTNSAAIHRSPDLKPFEGRVLLTMDIVNPMV